MCANIFAVATRKKMTFKTLLSHGIGSNGLRLNTHGNSTVLPEVNNYNRADYIPPHGWLHKRGHNSLKAGSALNALTLLAFLFFLNLLQNCLKENMTGSQPPIVILMSGDNTTDMNGTKVVRTKRGVRENSTENDVQKEPPIIHRPAKYQHETTEAVRNMGYDHTSLSTEETLIQTIHNNADLHWTNEQRNAIRNKIQRGKRRQKSIDQDVFNFFKSFFTDEDTKPNNTSNPETKEATTNHKHDKNKTEKNKEKKDKRINDKVSDLHEPDYDKLHVDQDGKDPSLFGSLVWKAIESFKPGIQESAEDTVCCRLVACESSRLSKKLGGYVKYLMNRYVKRGLEWICKTEEKDMKQAFRIGREGKSCADEIDECKPKNFITDVVLFIDYLIV